MEDSFFGFDTTAPLADDGGEGRIAEPSEEEYDALNDETFGSAINGDWEGIHENLVRLTDTSLNCDRSGGGDNGGRNEYGAKNIHRIPSATSSRVSTPAQNSLQGHSVRNADSDLELNLSNMQLDDVDLHFGDNETFESGAAEGKINMDPSVWASHPIRLENDSMLLGSIRDHDSLFMQSANLGAKNSIPTHADDYFGEHFASPYQDLREQIKHQQHTGTHQIYPIAQLSAIPPKICNLEDIERNLIIHQSVQKQQYSQQQQKEHQLLLSHLHHDQCQQQQKLLNEIINQPQKTATHGLQHQTQQKQQQQAIQKGPPGISAAHSPSRSSNTFGNNISYQLMQQQQQQSCRLPPGFPLYQSNLAPHAQPPGHTHLPLHPMLHQQHGLQPSFSQAHQRSLANPHLPIALNNFAMHPNFSAMRAAAAAAGIHPAALITPTQQAPRLPPHPHMINHQQPSNSVYNMFNMRLVQEIQQNHPLLQNNTRQVQQQTGSSLNNGQQQRSGVVKLNHRHDSGQANGNLPHEEFDEYSNLMSTRDKHWLIGIQLSQLNTDTPYIDDYYYTVYRERKAVLSGDLRHSQAHKDNQLNHPLTQPKGHAQLILVQMGNKNGTRNGQHRISESSGGTHSGNCQDQKTPYIFTPLKFENSLGKLQYGSVTAPRKIIDADIMSADAVNNVESGCNKIFEISTMAAHSQSVTDVSAGPSHSSNCAIGDITMAQRKSRHILLHIETLYRVILKLEDLDNPNAIVAIVIKKKKELERILALEQLENANKTSEERAAELINPSSVNSALKNKFAYEIEKKEVLMSKLTSGLTHDKVVSMMNVRKGKALIRRLMPYIENHDIRWNVWIGVLSALQNVVKKDRADTEGILYALYPDFKKQVQGADFMTVVKISASIPLNNKNANGIFCSKFGISSLVCLILQAEKIYIGGQEMDVTFSNTLQGNWREFLDQVATSLNRTIQNHTICAAIESDSIQPMMNHFARFKDLKLDSLLALITVAKEQIN